MELFSLREREIFESLEDLRGLYFTVIGGYAVSAFALPRFSVDCDVVVKDKSTADKICAKLEKRGYAVRPIPAVVNYAGSFCRLEKKLDSGLKASFDILIGGVFDRKSKAFFPAEWIFSHSSQRSLRGKTFPKSIALKVTDVDALIALKLVSSRSTDLRDVFMLLPSATDLGFIKSSVGEKTDLKAALERLNNFISLPDFKKNLQGVYGFVDPQVFQKHVKAVEKLLGSYSKMQT